MKKILIILCLMFLLAGTLVSGDVFINEFESNPASGSEWVEIFNAGQNSLDINNWKLYDGLSSEGLKHTFDTILEGREYYVVDVSGLNNGGEFLTLRNEKGEDVDWTPVLEDKKKNDKTHQRVPDGTGDFVFKGETRGKTNEDIEVPQTTQSVTQNVRVTVVLPQDTKIYSPENDAIYNSKRILFNITAEGLLDYIKYSDNGGRFRTLCKNCDKYGFSRKRTKTFRDGFHDLVIKGIVKDTEFDVGVQFLVDSKKPRIRKTYPLRGFSKELFELEFVEENPVFILLNYGNDLTGFREQEVVIDDCYDYRRRKKCGVEVDLSDYDGQEISYWFELGDIAGNKDESRHRELKVDTTPPVLKVNSPKRDEYGRRVPFNISVSEDVKIEYYDKSSSRPRWRRLCSRCDEYGFERKRTKSFKKGVHEVLIRGVDKAGNSDVVEIRFEVV